LLKVFWFLVDSKLMGSVVVFKKVHINSLKQPEGWVSNETKKFRYAGTQKSKGSPEVSMTMKKIKAKVSKSSYFLLLLTRQ